MKHKIEIPTISVVFFVAVIINFLQVNYTIRSEVYVFFYVSWLLLLGLRFLTQYFPINLIQDPPLQTYH